MIFSIKTLPHIQEKQSVFFGLYMYLVCSSIFITQLFFVAVKDVA